MKWRSLVILILLAAFILVLPGCQCKHEWETKSCLTPQICSLCGEASEEAPGHQWRDADWDEPKTCMVCGLTEGSNIFSHFLDVILAEKGMLPNQCDSLLDMCCVCFQDRIILSDPLPNQTDPFYTLTFGNVNDVLSFMERAQTLCYYYGSAHKPGEICNLLIKVNSQFEISCSANGPSPEYGLYIPSSFTNLTIYDESSMKNEIQAAYDYTFGDSLLDKDSYMEWKAAQDEQ